MTRIIPVVSGSRKVGKTTICANMAHHLSGKGLRTCILSFDLKTGQAESTLGVRSEHDLSAVFDGEKTLEDILVRTDFGVDVIPAHLGRELPEDDVLDKMSQLNLYMGEMIDGYDVLLLDTPSGITRQAVACALASPEIIMVFTPDPKAVTGAHDMLDVLTRNGFNEKVSMVVNQSQGDQASRDAIEKLMAPVGKQFSLTLGDSVEITFDPMVADAAAQNRLLGVAFPDAPAAKGIGRMTEQLVENKDSAGDAPGMGLFWEQLSMIAQFPLDFSGVPEPEPESQSEPELVPMASASPETIAAAAPEASAPVEEAPPIPLENRHVEMKTVSQPIPQAVAPMKQAPHQTIVSGGTVSLPGMDQALGRLANGIEAISRELASLRKMLENRSPLDVAGNGDAKSVKRVDLDFEAYRAVRESKEKTTK